jgi:hypothetical protein
MKIRVQDLPKMIDDERPQRPPKKPKPIRGEENPPHKKKSTWIGFNKRINRFG